ncbi:heterokaryon incompatibility protein-domain-containing protein [Pyronema domesticum]|nr:heterokaryon incompatibility protein-domain-containing protein [Pyronema domesticum]
MWLLHTETLTLEPSDGSKNYAILSHCWGDEKVTFDNISTPEASTLPGYHKIKMCCSTAKRYGFDYVWIDTCCIDKRSSTELSEAINSMYKWYAAAELCFVYLDDYTEEDPSVKTQQRAGISESRWFTRGWTLQELLAPKELVFFNSDWEEFGTRSILKGTISKITGIDTNALNGNFGRGQRQGSYSVAQKMAWAAERKTTREEDIAYCLLGIFDICMPIIYGEGMKAFERLQLEIMKFSDDQSILAWRHERDDGIELVADDPLAKHPKYFSLGGSIQYRSALSSSYAMTNIGLNIELPLVPINITEDFVMKTVGKNSGLGSLHFLLKHEAGYQSYMAFLNCTVTGERGRIAIYLWTNDNETFCRVSPGVLVLIHEDIEAINSSLAMHLHVTLLYGERKFHEKDDKILAAHARNGQVQTRRIYLRALTKHELDLVATYTIKLGEDVYSKPSSNLPQLSQYLGKILVTINMSARDISLFSLHPCECWGDLHNIEDQPVQVWFNLPRRSRGAKSLGGAGLILFKAPRKKYFAALFFLDPQTFELCYNIIDATDYHCLFYSHSGFDQIISGIVHKYSLQQQMTNFTVYPNPCALSITSNKILSINSTRADVIKHKLHGYQPDATPVIRPQFPSDHENQDNEVGQQEYDTFQSVNIAIRETADMCTFAVDTTGLKGEYCVDRIFHPIEPGQTECKWQQFRSSYTNDCIACGDRSRHCRHPVFIDHEHGNFSDSAVMIFERIYNAGFMVSLFKSDGNVSCDVYSMDSQSARDALEFLTIDHSTEEKSILKPKTEAFLPILRDTSRCTIHVKVIEHQGMDDTPNVVSAFISIRDHETYHEASAEQSDIGTPDFDDPDAPDQVFTSSDASEPEDLDSSELPESFRSCIDMEEFCEEAHSDSDFGDPEAADQIFASSDHGDDEDANQPPVSFNFIIAEPELPDESHLTSSAKITKRLRESSAGLPGNPTPNTDVLSRADTSTTLSHSATDMTTAKRLRLGDTI